VWTVFIFAGGLTVCGCELFTTRTPETPTGTSGDEWRFPFTPQTVLENLISAVESRSTVDYMRNFEAGGADSAGFEFLPDPETAANYPGVFDDWNAKDELAWVQSLFSPSNIPPDSLTRLEVTTNRETVIGDSADLTAQYSLHVGHIRPTVPRDMAGRLKFKLLRASSGGWYVFRWADFRSPDHACWSDLKAQF